MRRLLIASRTIVRDPGRATWDQWLILLLAGFVALVICGLLAALIRDTRQPSDPTQPDESAEGRRIASVYSAE